MTFFSEFYPYAVWWLFGSLNLGNNWTSPRRLSRVHFNVLCQQDCKWHNLHVTIKKYEWIPQVAFSKKVCSPAGSPRWFCASAQAHMVGHFKVESLGHFQSAVSVDRASHPTSCVWTMNKTFFLLPNVNSFVRRVCQASERMWTRGTRKEQRDCWEGKVYLSFGIP